MSFRVRATHDELAQALRWHLAPFLRPRFERRPIDLQFYPDDGDPREDPPRYRFVRNGRLRLTAPLPGLLDFAILDILSLVSTLSRDFLLLHAGAVARGGHSTLIPAAPESGKSTLVMALLRAGFDYLSDELGAIDPASGRAYPFPKHISVGQRAVDHFPGLAERLQDRAGLSGELWKRYIRPEDLAAKVADPSPIRSIVFLAPNHQGPARLIEVSKAEAVEMTVRNCFNLPIYGDRGLILLSEIVRGSAALTLEGGTPGERAELLAERLG